MVQETTVPLVETVTDTFKSLSLLFSFRLYNVWGSKAKPHCC